MTDEAPGQRSFARWLPLGFALLLTLPFDPFWLDFEQSRRALMLLLLGALMLVAPRLFRTTPAGEPWLLLWLGWGVLGAATGLGDTVWSLTLLALAHGLGLWTLLRLVGSTGRAPWQDAFAITGLLTACFGLLQSLGLASIGSYGQAWAPVSVFGNLNVAAEFTAVTGAVAAVAFARNRLLFGAVLVTAGAYAIVNGSRSALVALPIAVLFAGLWPVAAKERPTRAARLLPIGLLAGGLAIGTMLAAISPTPADAPPVTNRTATLEVRLHIADSALNMVADNPLFGAGLGQFAVQYPRFRKQAEIEISSFGRQESRAVESAHDDWLQAAVEGGLPGFVLLFLFAMTQWQAALGRRRELAPLVALALLMLVRSPVGNAPAVAAALLCCADPLAPGVAAALSRGLARTLRVLGIAAFALGFVLLCAQTQLARYLELRVAADAPLGEPARLVSSASWWPYDPVPWQLLAQERLARAEDRESAQGALEAADRAVALRPNEPTFHVLRGEILIKCDRPLDAESATEHAIALDPGDPLAHLQLAAARFSRRDFAGTVEALYDDPPQRLRDELPKHFEDFANLAVKGREVAAHLELRAEASMARAMAKALADDVSLAKAAFDLARTDLQLVDKQSDPRIAVLGALLALKLEDIETARALAPTKARLTDVQRRFMRPHLEALAEALPEEWR